MPDSRTPTSPPDGAPAPPASPTRRDRRRFLRSFLAGPGRVGAVLPTSARTVRDTLDMAAVGDARLVVELGAGTGVYTEELLRRLRPDAELLAFEVDPALADGLRRDHPDPRLRVLTDSAARIGEVLAGRRPQVVVSGLPFTSLPASVRTSVLDGVRDVLAEDGVFLVLQYSPFVQGELNRRFPSVRRRLSPLNVPPAVLFACRPAEPPA